MPIYRERRLYLRYKLKMVISKIFVLNNKTDFGQVILERDAYLLEMSVILQI